MVSKFNDLPILPKHFSSLLPEQSKHGRIAGFILPYFQRLLAEDAAAIFLYQPHWLTAARKGLQGLWEQMPISVNDLATLRWQ